MVYYMQIISLFIKVLIGAFLITMLMLSIDNGEKISGYEYYNLQYLCFTTILISILYSRHLLKLR